MHTSTFLYKAIHSRHHRLYVPYSYGALYNHPVEGFLLDSCGAVIAEWLTGMSVRQAAVLFTIATFKTVDDHCGYSLPFDPLQWFTGNNSDYHDIHHQVRATPDCFGRSCTNFNHRSLGLSPTSHNRFSCIGMCSLGRG